MTALSNSPEDQVSRPSLASSAKQVTEEQSNTREQTEDEAQPVRGIPLAFLSVEGVIMHEIPDRPTQVDIRTKSAEDTVPFLSDVETELTPELRHYLENKIKVALEEAAFPVRFLDDTNSIVPGLVCDLLGKLPVNKPDQPPPEGFIEASQEMAVALHASQSAISPPGLLAVVRGTLKDQPFMGLLKVEREEGLRLERDEKNGLVMMRAIVEHDLVMTQNTKVFKTGLFRPSVGGSDAAEGWVSDEQTGYGGAGRIAADFFVRKFLGCHILDLPEVLTKKFFDATERWINRSVQDPVEKASYTRALLAELSNNEPKVKPRSFAETHFHGEHRQGLISGLAASEAPTSAFIKDTSLIDNHLREVKIRFRGGINVAIARQHFDAGVATIETDEEDPALTKLVVRGVVERIHGG
jgi:hypothetical protein